MSVAVLIGQQGVCLGCADGGRARARSATVVASGPSAESAGARRPVSGHGPYEIGHSRAASPGWAMTGHPGVLGRHGGRWGARRAATPASATARG